jgi:hypothetical protein
MAIRPTDIQGAIWQASQTAPLAQRAEDGPRVAQQTAQASFAAQVQEREERVNETGEALGTRIDPNAERQSGGDSYEPHDGHSRSAFETAVDDAAGLDEPHLIDYRA